MIKQVVSRNDVPSWVGLLSFSKKCLQTPVRRGKRWSLATLINKQVTQEPSTEMPATRPPQRVRPPKKHNQMEQLASRVSPVNWKRVITEGLSGWLAARMLLQNPVVRPYKPSKLSIPCHRLTLTSLPWNTHHHLLSPLIPKSS